MQDAKGPDRVGITRGGVSGWAKHKNCFFDNAFGGSTIWHSDDTAGRAAFSNQNLNNVLPGRFIGTYQTQMISNGNLDYRLITPPNFTPDIALGAGGVTGMTLNATTLTFTLANAGQWLCEGDILTWQMLQQFGGINKYRVPAFKIPVGGISGNNVTANMLFDPAQYDTVANNVSNQVFVVAHFWAPTQPLTCTTNGTVNLTNVSPVGALVPGDFVIGCGPNGADIPTTNPLPRVKTNDGAGNVTLSVAATGSHSGVGLRFCYLSPVSPEIVTVATLPPGIKGLRYMVSDASAPVFGSAVVGGGAVQVPVYADATNTWMVG